MEDYETMEDALNNLVDRGYSVNLHMKGKSTGLRSNEKLNTKDFKIDEIYYFDETGDLGEEVIIMAMSSKKFEYRGIVINAFDVGEDTEGIGLFQFIANFFRKFF